MESIRIPFMNDAYGNPVFARVSWSKDSQAPKPTALVYHGGGLMVGSDQIIPKPQVDHLASQGFLVVIPNYRLAPQVTAKESFADSEEAYDWATSALPEVMKSEHGVEVETSSVVAYGHSSGGTLALHMASCKPLKAVTAFYPSLFNADTSTGAHKPMTAAPFGSMPDFHPNDDEWAEIKPEGRQLSEAAFAAPGTPLPPRTKWQMHLLKHGEWMSVVLPDSDFAAIDPMTRLTSNWPPIMIVQGEMDDVGGSSLQLAQRAEEAMKAAGVKEVELEVVKGESHMFDLPPMVGTSDLGHKWQAVLKGLDWLKSHV